MPRGSPGERGEAIEAFARWLELTDGEKGAALKMGFDSCETWKSKRDVVKAQLREGRFEPGLGALDSKIVRDGLWSLWRNSARGEAFIVFDLIEHEGTRWYVKSMSAAEFPYYFDCPIKFLDQAREESADWRAMVRDYWRQHGWTGA